ncbi:MAG: hypothetical protein KIT11_05720 [Fimbriimonadaceae bacterium]|nr:hypothetical protein [Fimbriimonadaceae bacterium]QYK56609.1 MAG: hypothetical protein KF733_03795 [Fimbriimonadaceae bacterium]
MLNLERIAHSTRLRFLALTAIALLTLPAVAQTSNQVPQRVKKFEGTTAPASVASEEAISAVFAVVGNLVRPDGTLATDLLQQSFKDMNGLVSPPAMLIPVGGVAPGGQGLAERLKAFSELAKQSGLQTKIAPTVGPEVGSAAGVDTESLKTWRAWAAENGVFPKTETTGPANYTTMVGRTMMVFLDTVTPQSFGKKGRVDLIWLQDRLKPTLLDQNVDSIIVFGSDPIAKPNIDDGLTDADLEWVASPEAAAVRNLLLTNPKFAGYICGRPGQYSLTSLREGTRFFQIVVGNSGGKLDEGWSPRPEPFEGFVALVVYSSGRVELVPYTKPASAQTQPAKAARSMNIFVPQAVAK